MIARLVQDFVDVPYASLQGQSEADGLDGDATQTYEETLDVQEMSSIPAETFVFVGAPVEQLASQIQVRDICPSESI